MSALSSQFLFALGTGTSTATSVAIPSAAVAPDGSADFKSAPQQGDGFYGIADGLHTVTYTVTPNFAGNLCMEATLASNPIEGDWFTATNTTVTYTFPIVPASTTTNYVNFTGNFVWVRARVRRSADQPNGSVLFINYNH